MASPKRFAAVAAVYQAIRLAVRPGGPSLGERAGAMPRLVRANRRVPSSSSSALVMSWLATQFVEETEAFLAWELAQVAPAYATASGYSVPSDTPFDTRFDTVRGNVVS